MPAFYLTFLAVLLAGLGGRDQFTIAALSRRQGGRPAILVVALCTGALAVACMVWASTYMLREVPAPARMVFSAIALALAGGEALLLGAPRAWREPTHSLGALALVLLAQQVSDAARFLVLGLGVGMAAPYASGAAGMLGTGLLCGLAWGFPDFLGKSVLRPVRRGGGALLVLVALYLLFSQMQIL